MLYDGSDVMLITSLTLVQDFASYDDVEQKSCCCHGDQQWLVWSLRHVADVAEYGQAEDKTLLYAHPRLNCHHQMSQEAPSSGTVYKTQGFIKKLNAHIAIDPYIIPT